MIPRGPIGVEPGQIEHTSLPSGLHLLKEDLVLFTHPSSGSDIGGLDDVEAERLAGCALFRSRDVIGGRGRRMGSLGVILRKSCLNGNGADFDVCHEGYLNIKYDMNVRRLIRA